MTVRKYSSRAQQTTLSSPITSTASTMTVVSGSSVMGGKTLTGAQTYTVVIDPDTALEEIVDITVYSSGNTLTITRGVDGPTPGTGVAHSAGAVVRHMAIGRDYQESNDHIEATTGHGATGAVVGTTNTQVITNKDLTSATNTLSTSVVTLTGTQTLTNKSLTSPTITGTGAIAGTFTGNLTGNVTGNVSGTAGSATGNAGTATALATARTFQILGDVEASGQTFDGTGNVNLTTSIATGVIVNADVNASAAIAATKIAGTAVTQADTGTVTSTMILNGTILDADVSATAAIAKTKLNLGGTITSADLVDGTIVATDIADGTITAAKMVTDPYARANHTGTQLAATVSDFDTQVRTSRLDQMAAPTASVALNTQKITGLGTPTLSTDASTKAYVDAQITALVGGAPGTLNTLAEIASAISSGGSFESTVVLKSGSTMTGALTLSGAPTVDLHAATKAYVDTVAGSATAAAASATAAAASYDSFDDRYLGPKSTAPSVDNDGNALVTGALYWNSVSNAMFAWTGSAWGSISSTADIFRYRYTASGGETSESGPDDNGLTLSYIVGKEQVYLNGVLLVRSTDYVATNGTSIASLAALAASDILEIITFTAFDLANVISPTVIDAKGDLIAGTSADTIGKLTVGTNGQYLQADSSTATGLTWSTVSGYSAPTLGSTSIASGATVSNVAGLTINSTTIPTSKTLLATDSTVSDGTVATAARGVGYMGIPQSSAATTGAYTVLAADAGEHIYSTATRTITIDSNANLALPVGTAITFIAATGATVTIAITSDTLLLAGAGTTGSRTLSPFGMATAIKITSTSWIISGNGLA